MDLGGWKRNGFCCYRQWRRIEQVEDVSTFITSGASLSSNVERWKVIGEKRK